MPPGEFRYELESSPTGGPATILDIAWPDGLQQGYSRPVAVLVDTDLETEEIANKAGFLSFSDFASFKAYVEHEILALDADIG